ncbi:MAG TPA: 30S ribosomal protein S1 [Sphingobacteriaceae bacterium]|nr:30S ribosomal protein S1 [Sphingobacteriaceae bacterium]
MEGNMENDRQDQVEQQQGVEESAAAAEATATDAADGATTPDAGGDAGVVHSEEAVPAPETDSSETTVEAPAAEADQPEETAAQVEESGEQQPVVDVKEIRTGDVLKGTVIQVRDDHLLVDVGINADGVVPLSELTLGPRQKPADGFQEGQEIYVQVLSIDDRDGVALLVSERRARAQRAWQVLEEALNEKTIITAPVVEEVKGGLVVDVGVRAFMPASHVDRGYVSDLSQYVGKNVRARVIELDKSKNRVILSQRVVLEEEHQKQRSETWANLEEGQIRTGVVKGLTDFGAFIDLGGVDGLLHVSEMAWGRVEHPRDVVQEGQEIQVMVLKVDRERERVSLGLKQVLPDPWIGIEERYTEGAIVQGRVERIAPFGAFVQVEPGVEGLVHISQMADHRVSSADEVVKEGDVVHVKILKLQPEERRISLSLREARRDLGQLESARRERASGQEGGQKPAAESRAPQRRSQPRSAPRTVSAPREVSHRDNGGENMTLGEMFGDLLEETKERLEQAAGQGDQQAAAAEDDADEVAGAEAAGDVAGDAAAEVAAAAPEDGDSEPAGEAEETTEA